MIDLPVIQPAPVAEQYEETVLPRHLALLPHTRWALWRWAGLRGAGFPIQQVLRLSVPDCMAIADQLIDAERDLSNTRNEIRGLLLASKKSAPAAERRSVAENALRQLNKGKLPDQLILAGVKEDAVNKFRAAFERFDRTQSLLRQTFHAASSETSRLVREIASDELFREAVTWQNRRALHSGIDALLRMDADKAIRGSQQRQREELVVRYLQRYCAKNDTIGFFGPVGWARLVPTDDALVARPGPDLLAERKVYFETWCIDGLANALMRDKKLRPWIAPRLLPHVHVEGRALSLPLSKPITVSAGQSAILEACDGVRTAKQIGLGLLANGSVGFNSEEDIYKALEAFRGLGLISWTIEAPLEVNPDKALRAVLERIADETLYGSCVGPLVELQNARDAVALAAGDADRLDAAMNNLEASFTRLTGQESTRSHGETYAARTLIYEDCRRNIEVEVGQEMLQTLGLPLSLMLKGARWFTFELAACYLKQFKQIYKELAQRSGSATIDFASFWYKAQPSLFQDKDPHVEMLMPVFQDLWEEVLNFPPGAHRVAFTSEQLRPRILAAFNAPRPGWKYARYHSPDLMIAASGTDAIRRGAYELVLGELHLAENTLGFSLFMDQHPCPEEMFDALEYDMPTSRLVPIIPKSYWPGQTARLLPVLTSPKDFRLQVAADPTGISSSQILPLSALVVEECDNELVVRTRDGQVRFDMIECFADFLTSRASNCFKILRPATHTPRITIDRLVICRESWNFDLREMGFAFEKDRCDRFVAARKWARANGLPRFVFVRVPGEVKPVYIDFAVPVLIDILSKLICQASNSDRPAAPRVAVTEMFPGPDQLWLPDSRGRRYTSEFRMVAVDLDAIEDGRGRLV